MTEILLSEQCPVCDNNGAFIRHLDSEFIRRSLGRYFRAEVPSTVDLPAYDLLRCTKCLLEYASPMKPGDNSFYTWITNIDKYYPNVRWEWPVVVRAIQASRLASARILEVGCGSGAFLSLLRESVDDITAIGLDPTEDAIRECRSAGLECYTETLEEYASNPDHGHKQFDFICAFHCLEHVSEPKHLLRSMKALTHASSQIFLSTPYSPMSIESAWHDPLNHPPHHLTRWNASAYSELAARVGMEVDLVTPGTANCIYRMLAAINLAIHGPNNGPLHRVSTALAHPVMAFREIRRQTARERLHGKAAPDVVLATFRAKN